MNRYVVYSAIVGGYDNLSQPLVTDKRFDFVLFTNDILQPTVGVWQIRHIDYKNEDNTRVCRFIKTHPHTLLPDYEVSVWIDSNIQITHQDFYEKVVELDITDVPISSMWHLYRHCIYEEAFAVVNLMVEHEKVVVDWCHHIRKEHYPRGNGLCETNVLYRKQLLPITNSFNKLWWECINSYSRRDQLSFNYVLWKVGIPCVYFLGEGKNVRNTDLFRIIAHNNLVHNHCILHRGEAWLMRHCWKKPKESDKIETLYYKLYAWPFPHFWISLIGQYYRIIDFLNRNER